MPALNFQLRFALRVAQGSKPHTIRAWRQRPFRVGDNLSFFTGMRTKSCRRLRANAFCTSATPIEVHADKKKVWLDRRLLSSAEIAALARRDGFANVEEFWEFFAETHGPVLCGQLIQWQP